MKLRSSTASFKEQQNKRDANSAPQINMRRIKVLTIQA